MSNVVALAKEFLLEKKRLKAHDEKRSYLYGRLQEVERELLTAMGLQGVPRLTVDDRTLYITPYVSAKAVAERDDVAASLSAAGLESLLKQRFNLAEIARHFKAEAERQGLVDVNDALPPELSGVLVLTKGHKVGDRKAPERKE